ncbi:ubiquitin carboxyl-terminal hydrolase 37-like isoform X2 [Xiphias gladius]|uniref:ubiquitin carboxyl-terminal hydrolase 37-like isoform X2 n=1 Tax=Xiphias gladius TaxID=8245 RepID=UPI001A99E88C|nr:ubiquitin carboxyl-terminal hydrolase 37-like isoform X2 [Xiphias gladius]
MPAADTDGEKENPQRKQSLNAAGNDCQEQRHSSANVTKTDEQDEQGHSRYFSQQDQVMLLNDTGEVDPDLEWSFEVDDNALPSDYTGYPAIMEQVFLEALFKRVFNSTERISLTGFNGFKEPTVNRFGFPNIGQSCYMNSSLQGLLTLEDFVRSISCQERVWSSVPEAQLLRRLMDIRDTHSSTDPKHKSHCLRSFKEAVTVHAPEFRDSLQKDAHEFLISVVDQIRSLSPLLSKSAERLGRRYTCPVEDHLLFRMENTRRCKKCGAQSMRQEEFTNLSLDLVPGGSVEEMLQEYLMETELEFRCECGGRTSGQRSAFATLPRVLILHLKRFRLTSSFDLEKIQDAVRLQRDIVVSSLQGGRCYSLISAISHFGLKGEAGHYICDGLHPNNCPDEPTDSWFTYNDSVVFETTGSSVCQQRQNSAYVLFYKRHD